MLLLSDIILAPAHAIRDALQFLEMLMPGIYYQYRNKLTCGHQYYTGYDNDRSSDYAIKFLPHMHMIRLFMWQCQILNPMTSMLKYQDNIDGIIAKCALRSLYLQVACYFFILRPILYIHVRSMLIILSKLRVPMVERLRTYVAGLVSQDPPDGSKNTKSNDFLPHYMNGQYFGPQTVH